MALASLERSLSLVFGHEGGLSLDRRDKGNWTGGAVGVGVLKGTKYGISAMAYPTLDIARLTLADAAAIYRRDYWRKISGESLPAGVDHAVFDFAVNSGPARAAKYLQTIVGVKADGVIGLVTLRAVEKLEPAFIVRELSKRRLDFLKSLPTWPTYGKGWAKRVAKVEAEALAMLADPMAVNPPPPDVEPVAKPAKRTVWSWLKELF